MSLLKLYAKNCESLLDLGVGRGGDIFKIDRCNVKYLLGVDVEQVYLDEAISRYNNSKLPSIRTYDFIKINDNEPNLQEYIKNCTSVKQFNIISCQFAFHYYLQSEEKFKNVCRDISNLLQPGGYFIGSVLDGKQVHEILKSSKDKCFKNKCIVIQGNYDIDDIKGYGDEISFYMGGTLYFGESSVSKEYLVNIDILKKELENHGLELVSWRSFKDYYKRADEFRRNEQIPTLDEDTKVASFLYHTFAFKKKFT
jgi:mRNA (guanine-N7-)-methyltransferase